MPDADSPYPSTISARAMIPSESLAASLGHRQQHPFRTSGNQLPKQASPQLLAGSLDLCPAWSPRRQVLHPREHGCHVGVHGTSAASLRLVPAERSEDLLIEDADEHELWRRVDSSKILVDLARGRAALGAVITPGLEFELPDERTLEHHDI